MHTYAFKPLYFIRFFLLRSLAEGEKMENYYVRIKGKEVAVSEEVYRAYVQPIRREQRRLRRQWRCLVKGENGKLVRCQKSCDECEYAQKGFEPTGNPLSLQKLALKGFEIPDSDATPEEAYLEKERKGEELQRLREGMRKLPKRQAQVLDLYYYQSKSQEEIAQILGIQQPAVSKLLTRAHETLKDFLKNF